MQQGIGVNYGGWCAIYPTELLQESILNIATGQPTFRALLTVPPPFPYLQVQAQSPVLLVVSDPSGRQTGILTNGAIIENIPQSWYQPAVGDDEVEGTLYLTNETKTVVVNNPVLGAYQIQLIGTGSGNYTLKALVVGSNGQLVTSATFAGNISIGQQTNYVLSFSTTIGAPVLHIAHIAQLGAVVYLFWPSDATGFQLQSTTNVATADGWSSVTNNVAAAGGQNYVRYGITAGARYFRLVH
jgi:hypothetical protein